MLYLFLKRIIKEKVSFKSLFNCCFKKRIDLGGTFALCALLTQKSNQLKSKTKTFVNISSILAASLLIGMRSLS